MTITFGNEQVTVREWKDGWVLLITRDDAVKRRILTAWDEAPAAFEALVDAGQLDVDDLKDTFPILADRTKVALFFDLEHMGLGVCVTEEAADEEAEEDD